MIDRQEGQGVWGYWDGSKDATATVGEGGEDDDVLKLKRSTRSQ